jgi:hypothetical protein
MKPSNRTTATLSATPSRQQQQKYPVSSRIALFEGMKALPRSPANTTKMMSRPCGVFVSVLDSADSGDDAGERRPSIPTEALKREVESRLLAITQAQSGESGDAHDGDSNVSNPFPSPPNEEQIASIQAALERSLDEESESEWVLIESGDVDARAAEEGSFQDARGRGAYGARITVNFGVAQWSREFVYERRGR